MRRWLPVLTVVGAMAAAVVFAVLYFTNEPETRAVTAQPCGERVFGHVRSLARMGDRYDLRFDPAWFTTGVSANTAAAEDGGPSRQASPCRTTSTSSTRATDS